MSNISIISTVFAVSVAGLLAGMPAQAATLFARTFDTDTGTPALTLSTYDLTTNNASPTVSGMQLIIPAAGGQASVDFGSFVGDLTIAFDTTIEGNSGSINVGLRVGDNTFVFHPGYATGAFRIDGPGGHANADMGFTPSVQLSRFSFEVDGTTGKATIDIVNSAGTFHEVFQDTNYVAGVTTFGLSVGGQGKSRFDNLLVSSNIAPIPEPETSALMLTGLLTVTSVAWRKRARLQAV